MKYGLAFLSFAAIAMPYVMEGVIRYDWRSL